MIRMKLKTINSFLKRCGLLLVVAVDHECKTTDQDEQWNGVTFWLMWKGLKRTQRRARWNRMFGVEQ